ncbi:MAG TPA: hypothetical protein VKO18_15120 [Terriglobia bacterium]|nr:hypothetical protein [Terriglobia bacterium]
MKSALVKGLILLLLSAWWMAPSAAGQGLGQAHGDPQYPQSIIEHSYQQTASRDTTLLDDAWQRNLNPFKPGNTIKSSEIKCSIVEWVDSPPKPELTVVCPPPEIFAPLRVFLKFSWVDSKDVPKDAAKVVAKPRAETKIQLGKANIKVFLKISKDADDSAKEKWVAFNALQAFAIVPSETGSPHRQ